MNKLITLFILAMLTFHAYAQVNVTMHMTQKLGDESFAHNLPAQSDLGYAFNVTRLQYYISKIKLIHDGGLISEVTDMYFLVDPAEDSEFPLGTFDITQLEQVQFSIGVDADHNHLDPATYPTGHPLAPQNPSMNWGWNPGYRFIALEGYAGANSNSLNNNYQIHTIGDVNYKTITLDIHGELTGNEMELHIQADYKRLLDNLNISNGIISHASTGASKTIAENTRSVFSSLETTGITEPGVIGKFSISPNPSRDVAVFKYDLPGYNHLTLHITDITGKTVYSSVLDEGRNSFELALQWQPGIYIARVFNDNKFLALEKWVIE